MKKILGGALIAGTMISQVAAVDVLRTDDAYVNIYGTLRGYLGYGNTMTSHPYTINNDGLLFGIQGNSRIGVRAGVGSFNANVEIGANETTVYGSGANNIGLRQAWASYTFDGGGTLIAGKTDTLTSMSGFSSDFFFNDSGAAGFGGLSTSNRRFQIQYKIGGFGISLSENEVMGSQLFSGVRWVVPRISAGYSINSADLSMNLAASYAFAGQYLANAANDKADVNIFSLNFGIKPKLGDSAYVSFMLSYGLNDNLTEQSVGSIPGVLAATGKVTGVANTTFAGLSASVGDLGEVDNIHRVSALLELGASLTESLGVAIGGGYQYAQKEQSGNQRADTYSVYLNMPYKVSSFFSIIPQVGWYGLNTFQKVNADDQVRISSIVAAAQFKFSF